ncbi:MAG: PDZ domain-containing protein [Actinobacteria bacterium]|uniref:Unannotated protein n=1 Tax=freshwater metagenome TaxID=449393 RepID=A0A6J6NVH7_9ZZZZ|nr:PDZ domain-containing protein [Actinomycetota bacterium]
MRRLARVLLSGQVLFVVGVAVLGFALIVAIVPSHKYLFLPDPAHPVAPLVRVTGGSDPTDGGGIYFVDVQTRKATILESFAPSIHKGADLYSPAAVNPQNVSPITLRAEDLADMRRSHDVAAAVALRSLGEKVRATPNGILITGVDPDAPAAAVLYPNDVIVAIDGAPTITLNALARVMNGKKPGTTLSLSIRNARGLSTVRVKTVNHNGQALIGLAIEQDATIVLPRKVSIDSGDIGGPSAGLAFALDIVEELGRDVDHGHKVAATGEIFLGGGVGPIGGIKQKTYGARRAGVDVFLVPAGENGTEARRYAGSLKIIPVKSFQQALRALATLYGGTQ